MSEKRTDETTDLKEKTISGIHWRFLTTVTQLLLTFSVGVLLARILPPEDFGLLGMAIIFTGFADLFATVGMGTAIIQRKELDNGTIGTATFVSILSSLALTAFFFFAAPAIAAFFHEPRITLILRVLSVLFLLNGLSAISRALIVRELKFKPLFYQEIISFLFGYGVLVVVLAGAVTNATDNIYSEVKRQGFYAISLVILCLWGVRYGIEGVAVAVVLNGLVFYLSMAQFVLKILGISRSSFFKAQRTGAILAIIVGMVDIVCLIVFSRFQAALPPIVILFALIAGSLIGLCSGILILPKSLKGDSISWIMLRSRNIFPRHCSTS